MNVKYFIKRVLPYLFLGIITFLSAEETDSDLSIEEKEDPFSYETVDGLENWSHNLDIINYPPGIYNFIVEGKDNAGNMSNSDPINVYIDPESDKPLVNISNPEPKMKVSGRLNIIGTCLDDDGVDSIEIRVNDEEYRKASGGEFWSYDLDTKDYEDGPSVITVRGTDINGLVGNEISVEFILDKNSPKNVILSHDNGALVNGKIQLEGRSEDGNGIKKIEYRLDEEEKYSEISLKQSKKDPYGEFKIPLDTRDLKDGAQIVWIKSTDRSGSVGISPLLLFVDNNPPILKILYPTEEDAVDGQFTVTGTAQDDIGLNSLTFQKDGDDPEEIPLITGDPYWSHDFDFSGEKKAKITFILSDLTGNSIEYNLNPELDGEKDKPVIELKSPLSEETYKNPVLSGYLSDDDGVKEIVYTIDNGEPQKIPARFSFQTPLEGLAPGVHKLEVYALDRYDLAGETIRINFSVIAPPPEIGMEFYNPPEEGKALKYEQALELEPLSYKDLSGYVDFPNGAGSLFFSLDGSEEKKLTLGKSEIPERRSFHFSLKNILSGYHTLSLHAVDKAGLESHHEFYFIIKGAPPEIKLHYADDRFSLSGAVKKTPLLMSEKDSLTFYFEGDGPDKVELSANPSFLKSTLKDNRLILESLSSGIAENFTLTVTTKAGKTKTVGPFTFIADNNPPILNITMKKDLIWGAEELEVSGRVSDNVAIDKLSLGINDKPAISLNISEGEFREMIDLSSLSDGGVQLSFKLQDKSGKIQEETYLFRKSLTAPTLTQISPLRDRGANGSVTFTGIIKQAEVLASIEYAPDGVNFVSLDKSPFVSQIIELPSQENEAEKVVSDVDTVVDEDSLPEPDLNGSPIFRISDMAGNTTLLEPSVLMDIQGDKPLVFIQIPKENSLIQGDIDVSGMAFDDDAVKHLFYRYDGGNAVNLAGINSFEIPLQLEKLSDNKHTLEVKAVDKNGVEGNWEILNFKVSRNAPLSSLELPVMGETVKGIIDIHGFSTDKNGIKEVLISFDNGNSYNLMNIQNTELLIATEDVELPKASEVSDEKVNWHYSFNTELLKDGNHSLLIKAVDKYGISSLYTTLLSIDNTAPSLSLSEPAEGRQFTGKIDLKGFIEDKRELSKITLELQHLSQTEKMETIDLSLDNQIQENLDLSSFPVGWINMRIIGEDGTGNRTFISRNIKKVDDVAGRNATLITPFNGASLNGEVLVQGMVENVDKIESVQLYIDGSPRGEEVDIKDTGFFSTLIEKDVLSESEHTISVSVKTSQGETIETPPSRIEYKRLGPWIKLEEFSAGDYASNRPWLTGTAGYEYILPQIDKKELKNFQEERAVETIEISLDNGKTFQPVKGSENWKYRLETQEMGDGELWLLLRARFKDGTSATTKTVLIVDETSPNIELLTPDEGMRFNDFAQFTGIADDANGLFSVSAALRKGNKNSYQVPAFIQGLYLDLHFMGSTNFEAGLGLTFFDDNVKLQSLFGVAPTGRFSGNVFGFKLLANVASVPWEYFLGYDFKNFSTSFALGTTFQYFTMESDFFNSDGIMLGAMLCQVELLKINLPERKMFSSFSLYSEFQYWVVSSDVSAGLIPRFSLGLRTDIF